MYYRQKTYAPTSTDATRHSTEIEDSCPRPTSPPKLRRARRQRRTRGDRPRRNAPWPRIRRGGAAPPPPGPRGRGGGTAPAPRPPELGGRGVPDPVLYGDWEVKGLATDF